MSRTTITSAITTIGVYLGSLGNRMLVMTSLLPLVFTGAVVLIADISRPYPGNIRVSHDPLIWTPGSIQPAP